MSEFKNIENLTAQLLFDIIKANKKFIALFVVIGTVLVMVYSFIMPQEYQSSASILPPKGDSGGGGLSNFLNSFGGGNVVLGNLNESNQSRVFSDILASRSVAVIIDEKLNLSEKPEFSELEDKEALYEMIRDMLEIDVERSGVLLVSATTSTPYFSGSEDKNKAARLSAEIANAAVFALDQVVRRSNISSAKQSRIYIEGEINNYKSKLDSVERDLEKFQKENNVLSMEDQIKAIVTQAIDIGTELIKAETELNLAKIEFGSNTSKVSVLQEQVDFLRDQSYKIQSGGLNADAFSIPLKDVPEISRKYAYLYREQQVLEQVILYLETQRHQEAIQEERDIPIVEILDEAVKPSQRYAPSRKFMFLLSLILTSVISISIVTVRTYNKGKALEKEI